MEENNKNKNYTDIILEQINGKFDFLVEESKIVKEKIGSLENGFNSLDGKVTSLESKVDSLEIRFDSLEDKFDSLEKRFDSVEGKVDILLEDMDYVKSEIIEIKDHNRRTDEKMEQKAEKNMVENHENRLLTLENVALGKA